VSIRAAQGRLVWMGFFITAMKGRTPLRAEFVDSARLFGLRVYGTPYGRSISSAPSSPSDFLTIDSSRWRVPFRRRWNLVTRYRSATVTDFHGLYRVELSWWNGG
jgi:hypothetical protein